MFGKIINGIFKDHINGNFLLLWTTCLTFADFIIPFDLNDVMKTVIFYQDCVLKYTYIH